MREDLINKMVKQFEILAFYADAQRVPTEFYKLTDQEKAEVVKRYRNRNNLDKKPWNEEKA